MPLLRTLAVAIWLLACLRVGGFAQVVDGPADVPGPRGESSDSQPRLADGDVDVEQVKPDTYLLPDENGRLQPMLGWTFDDFLRVWKSRDATPPTVEEPEVSLQRLECAGQMENDEFLRLLVRINIRLQRDGRAAVPLAFPSGILREYSISPQDDTAFVEFDEGLGTHVLWIAGAAGESRDVQLEVLLPVAHRGNLRVLKFHPPRAAISSLMLTLAGRGIVAESLTPATQVSTSTEGETTIVTARGLAETTEIAWRTVPHAQDHLRSLVAEADMRVRAEPGVLGTEVILTIQDLHGPLDRFLVRLPAGHNLLSHELEFASLHQVADNGRAAVPAERASAGTTYEVRLAEPQQSPLRLILTLERPLALQEDESEVLLRGVEVVGAVRQQGRLHLITGDDLRVRWQEGQRVHQIAAATDAADGADVTASFEFDADDWHLPLVLALRPTEISVEPHYQLEIGREGVRLAATFRYSVRGTKQFDLRYALGPWQLADDPQGPESTISADNAYVDDAGTMYLPLANPAEGTFETTLHLKLPEGTPSSPLQFRLPECLDARVQDGELTVSVDRSLDAIPQTDSLLGLRPATRAVPAAAPPEPLDRSSQRYHVTSLPAEFAATVRERTRVVRNETSVDVRVYADHLQIEEEIRLDVRHLPIHEVVLQMPAAMAYSSSLELVVDGQSVPPTWEDPPAGSGGADRRIARLMLEQPRLGDLTIQVRLQVPSGSSRGPSGSLPHIVVPLAIPQADSHHLVAWLANHSKDLQVRFQRPAALGTDEDSPAYPPVNPGGRGRIELSSPTDGLTLASRPVATTSERALVIERTWIQSWVVGSDVQTRTVMRLVPTSRELVLLLGPNGSTGLKNVYLNGHPASAHFVSDEELVVDGDNLPLDVPCVLEVVQQGTFDEKVDGNLRVAPPRVANARGHRLVYWQLVVPRIWHAFAIRDELVSASPWRREGVYWVRTPSYSQAELEDFLDVPHTPQPTAAFSQLVYSGVDLPPVLEATLVRRSVIVLLTSGIILAVALAVLYIPVLQRGELAATAVILLAVAGTMYPDLAPFLLQAGTLGLVLTLVAVFLKRLAGQWQMVPARPSADTSIFRRETPSPTGQVVSPSSPEATSSARTLVPSLSDPGGQH